MRSLLAVVLVTVFSAAASAQYKKQMETVELKTLVTCQQTDGDFWYEVGIVQDPKGFSKILLVSHDTDAETVKLVSAHYATEKKSGNSVTFTSVDDYLNFNLTVEEKGKDLRGRFIYVEHGPNEALFDNRMECYHNSTISYEIEAGLEPRMSFGN